MLYTGADPGFCKGEEDGTLRWYLETAESMGHAPKFENWNLIENCYTTNTSNNTKKNLQRVTWPECLP